MWSALGRGHAVPELRPHGDAREFCGDRDPRSPISAQRGGTPSRPSPVVDAAPAGRANRSRALPRHPRVFGAIFGIAGLVVAKAGYTQVLHSAAIMGEGTLVTQADGGRRYQYNPRLQEIMREIPKGTIYDRNGLPLATSNWSELEKHRADYQALGIDIDRACPRAEARHYPFGGLMFDLLGDLRTRTRWGATNTSFVERDSARRLRGYDDPSIEEVETATPARSSA